MSLPADMEDGFEFLRRAAEQLAESARPPKRGDARETELGFSVEVVDHDVVRGNYDASRLALRNPKLVSAIAFLLGLHYMPWDVIASACGVDWETVAAVAELRKESIREFKGRLSQQLGLVMQAMVPVLMEKVRKHQVTFLDLKLLHDVWAPLSGEASSIVETRQALPALDGLMRVIAEEMGHKGEGAGMGLERGENLANGAGAGSAAGAVGPTSDGVREAILVEAEPVELGVEQVLDKH
jgi:hypothetical protein